jgi:hypothetical protein
MSGTAKVKPPRNNEEWARNTEKRLGAGENQTAVRVAGWTFAEQEDTGNLIVSHVDGGSVVLAVKPDAGDEPDEVQDTDDQPYIKVERQQNQAEARGAAHLVEWDTLVQQTGGWGFTPTATDLVIPRDGVYAINYSLHYLNSSSAVNKAIFLIDGVVRDAHEQDFEQAAYVNLYISNTYPLSAGQIISAAAFTAGSGTFDFGYSGADPTVFTSLSLTRLPVG